MMLILLTIFLKINYWEEKGAENLNVLILRVRILSLLDLFEENISKKRGECYHKKKLI